MNQRTSLTTAVERAQSGLREHVQALIEAIPSAQLIVPLARRLPGWSGGDRRHVIGGLEVTPNLLQNEVGHLLLPAFTYEPPIARHAKNWNTDGGPLQICTLPAQAVFDLAERLVDGVRVAKFVLDPSSPSELSLARPELLAVREGRALPLVEYARRLPLSPVRAAEGPSHEFVDAVNRILRDRASVLSHRVERWFDPERDIEPRVVITAQVTSDADQPFLAESLGELARELLKPGETVEVRFEKG